jgi:hypothetical protein
LAAALAEMLAAPPTVDPAIPASFVISWEQSAAMIDGLFRSLIPADRPIAATQRNVAAASRSA